MRTLLLLAAIFFFILSLTCFAAAASIEKKKPRKPVAVEDDVPDVRRVPDQAPDGVKLGGGRESTVGLSRGGIASRRSPSDGCPQTPDQRCNETQAKVEGSRTVDSTAYCLNENRMANGERPHDGAVAMDGVKFGTQVSVLSGPLAGRTFTVKDRTDGKTQADFWFRDCDEALDYGRRRVQVEIR